MYGAPFQTSRRALSAGSCNDAIPVANGFPLVMGHFWGSESGPLVTSLNTHFWGFSGRFSFMSSPKLLF